MKRWITYLTAVILVISMQPISAQEDYDFLDEANILHNLGVFDGKSSVTFVPALEDYLTRQEGMKVLGTFFSWTLNNSGDSLFEDVDSWAKSYVATAVDRGVTNGIGNQRFGGNDRVSYLQFYTWVLRELGIDNIYSSDKEQWEENIIYYCNAAGIWLYPNDLDGYIIRDHAIGVLYSVLSLASMDSSVSVYDQIRTQHPDGFVTNDIHNQLSQKMAGFYFPSQGYYRQGMAEVKVSHSNFQTLYFSNMPFEPTEVTLFLCYKNLCDRVSAKVVSVDGNKVKVSLPDQLETGVEYQVSGIIISSGAQSVEIKDLPTFAFRVINDDVDENSPITVVRSRSELDNIIETSSLPIAIDFYADWCGYCKLLMPLYDSATNTYDGSIFMIKVDVDDIDTSGFGFTGIPNQQFYVNGTKTGEISGYMNVSAETYTYYILQFFTE